MLSGSIDDDMMEESHLLGLDDPQHAWIGGKWETYETLGSSFLTAADSLAKTWAEAEHERLALPILQNYRHAIELALKGLCEQAAQHVTFGLKMGMGRNTVPTDLAKKLGASHSIAQLVNLFHCVVAGIPDSGSGQLPSDVQAILVELHNLDSNGQTFRYATAYDKQAHDFVAVRPTEEPIELRKLINELHQAGWMLVYGGFGWLDAYFEHLQEMWAEYQSEMRQYAD